MKILFRVPRLLWFIAAGLFMTLILYTSTQPTPHVENIQHQSLVDHILDSAHLPAYALLTFLLVMAFGLQISGQIGAFVVATLFGALNEWVQMGTPGRSSSLKDEIVNILGAFLTLFCVFIFRKKSI